MISVRALTAHFPSNFDRSARFPFHFPFRNLANRAGITVPDERPNGEFHARPALTSAHQHARPLTQSVFCSQDSLGQQAGAEWGVLSQGSRELEGLLKLVSKERLQLERHFVLATQVSRQRGRATRDERMAREMHKHARAQTKEAQREKEANVARPSSIIVIRYGHFLFA